MFFILIFSILILVAVLYYRLRFPYVKLLNKIPGPDGLPILGMAFMGLLTPRDQMLAMYENNFHTYGRVYRAWAGPIGIIFIGGAEGAQAVLSPNSHLDKSFQYEFFKPWVGSGMLTSGGEKWHHRLRLIAPAFHTTMFEKFFDTMVKNSKLLVRELESEIGSPQFDITPYIRDCSLHNICETAMGVKIHDEKQLRENYFDSVYKYSQTFYDRMVNPFLYLTPLFSLSSTYRKQKKAVKILHQTSMKVIEKRIAERRFQRESDNSNNNWASNGIAKQKLFLDILLDISEQDGNAFTVNDVRAEVDTFLLGGHNSLSMTLYWAIYLVGLDPVVQENIHTELDGTLGSAMSPMNMKMLDELHYLECVIKESLRLYAPVPVIGRTLGKDAMIDGYKVPAGNWILFHIHQIHRLQEHYHNPDEFDPSHFFPENSRTRHPFAFIPFGGGPRHCPGQKFAMMEMKIVLATFFKHYKVRSLTKREDMKMLLDAEIRPANGILVQIHKRNETLETL